MGVPISVTTVPAAAYFGVAIGVGQTNSAIAREALATLGASILILVVVGSLTLMVQRRLTARFRRK